MSKTYLELRREQMKKGADEVALLQDNAQASRDWQEKIDAQKKVISDWENKFRTASYRQKAADTSIKEAKAAAPFCANTLVKVMNDEEIASNDMAKFKLEHKRAKEVQRKLEKVQTDLFGEGVVDDITKQLED